MLLGEKLLPAPVGEPQTLHLPDGSMLVPVARVDAAGNRTPLTGGAGSAPLRSAATAAPAAASAAEDAPAAIAPATAATPVSGGGDAAFEPHGFLYNDRYFAKFHDAGGIDLADSAAVEERAVKSTFAYLLKEEPEVDDFGVTDVKVRPADATADADLLHINPRAHFVIDVNGVTGTGRHKSIPSVMNRDGAVFVDPRIRGY